MNLSGIIRLCRSSCVIILVVGATATVETCSHQVPPDPVTVTDSSCATPPSSTTVPVLPTPCPDDMVLVGGTYHARVTHQCVAVRDQETGETRPIKPGDDDSYCQAWQPGKAKTEGAERELRFCIDRHEWPNRPGALPEVMVRWGQAQAACEQVGKRLCGDDEWTLACEGPGHSPVAYGWSRDGAVANINRPQVQPPPDATALLRGSPAESAAEMRRVDQREPIAARDGDTSAYGAYAMTGNVDEWVNNTTLLDTKTDEVTHRKVMKVGQYLFKGGHWVRGKIHNNCRAVTVFHSKDAAFRFYAEGFRCCAAADPQVADMSVREILTCH